MDNKQGYIYEIRNNKTGSRYIGQTIQGVRQRFNQHCAPSSGCTYLSNAIQKYGKENFTVKTLMTIPVDELDRYEIYYIKIYNTLVPGGYNLNTGGSANKVVSDETKKKLSVSHMGKKHTEEQKLKMSISNSGINHPNYGKTRKEETKNKISETKALQNKTGERDPKFNYGCISIRESRVILSWNENKVRKTKSFAFSKYCTREEALNECKNFRKEIYPAYNPDTDTKDYLNQ